MATFTLCCFLALPLCCVLFIASTAHTCSPYLSPLTFSKNYQKMVTSFRVFMYTPPQPLITTPPASLFYDSLIESPFLTQDPNQADLFFVLFSPDTSTRSLTRVVRELRSKYPYWNRTLGADHFFISPTGIDFSSDRNVLELKKNSVQISVFPTTSGYFIPHKDITLPNPSSSSLALSHAPPSSFLAYLRWDGNTESDFVNALRLDPDFLVESEPLYHAGRVNISSKFCLFFYHSDVAGMTEAMAVGCVPAIIVDSPVQDFPLTDVLRWSEMALLVGSRRGPDGLTAVLRGVTEDKYQRMREFCVAATHHMVWNAESQPYDAFHMVMYQLWMRRHTIRYTRREEIEAPFGHRFPNIIWEYLGNLIWVKFDLNMKMCLDIKFGMVRMVRICSKFPNSTLDQNLIFGIWDFKIWQILSKLHKQTSIWDIVSQILIPNIMSKR